MQNIFKKVIFNGKNKAERKSEYFIRYVSNHYQRPFRSQVTLPELSSLPMHISYSKLVLVHKIFICYPISENLAAHF